MKPGNPVQSVKNVNPAHLKKPLDLVNFISPIIKKAHKKPSKPSKPKALAQNPIEAQKVGTWIQDDMCWDSLYSTSGA